MASVTTAWTLSEQDLRLVSAVKLMPMMLSAWSVLRDTGSMTKQATVRKTALEAPLKMDVSWMKKTT